MAQSPSYNSRPSLRYNERRWLAILAALAVFAYYIASNNLALWPSDRPASPAAFSETSSSRSQQAAVEPAVDVVTEIAVPIFETTAETSAATAAASPEPGRAEAQPVVSTAEAPAPQPATNAAAARPAPQPATSAAAAQPAPQPATSAAQPAPAAPPVQAPAEPAERWSAAGIVIVTQGQEWDEQSLKNVDAALAALPAGVRAQLGNPALGQLHILVNTQGRALSGKQPYGGAANYFSTGDGVNELVMYPKQRVSTILHELGHAYNLRRTPGGHYAKVLLDPEMESFMAATGWKVLASREQIAQSADHMRLGYEYSGIFRWPELSKFDPLEDFANSFAMYFYDPTGLKAQSPERFAWMAANLPR